MGKGTGGEQMRSQDRLITDHTDNYMEKVFYFCLRRTWLLCGGNWRSSPTSIAVWWLPIT